MLLEHEASVKYRGVSGHGGALPFLFRVGLRGNCCIPSLLGVMQAEVYAVYQRYKQFIIARNPLDSSMGHSLVRIS